MALCLLPTSMDFPTEVMNYRKVIRHTHTESNNKTYSPPTQRLLRHGVIFQKSLVACAIFLEDLTMITTIYRYSSSAAKIPS